MRKRFVVIDDFYTDPRAVRSIALSMQYDAHPGHTYPGKNSTMPYINDQITESVTQILGIKVKPSDKQVYGHFRSSTATDTYEQDIHVDPVSSNLWAGVLYLNTPEQCRDRLGTITWRHKKLNIETVPMNRDAGRQLGFSSYDDVRRELIHRDGLDRSLWAITNYTEMKFNRLVLFRPLDWHSHGENFGTTLENSRLVQIFFWAKAD